MQPASAVVAEEQAAAPTTVAKERAESAGATAGSPSAAAEQQQLVLGEQWIQQQLASVARRRSCCCSERRRRSMADARASCEFAAAPWAGDSRAAASAEWLAAGRALKIKIGLYLRSGLWQAGYKSFLLSPELLLG